MPKGERRAPATLPRGPGRSLGNRELRVGGGRKQGAPPQSGIALPHNELPPHPEPVGASQQRLGLNALFVLRVKWPADVMALLLRHSPPTPPPFPHKPPPFPPTPPPFPLHESLAVTRPSLCQESACSGWAL